MLLKTTKNELYLIADREILPLVGKSKRGGLAFVGAKRYAKANDKHMDENYDSKKESSYIHTPMLTTFTGGRRFSPYLP